MEVKVDVYDHVKATESRHRVLANSWRMMRRGGATSTSSMFELARLRATIPYRLSPVTATD